mmetsp:Transcript_41751/g.110294  ORF Transcript_41751/g.110294 Transcript_41751/m.110294 type:complete len:433 (+) Transcript_41751:32-1330(+)
MAIAWPSVLRCRTRETRLPRRRGLLRHHGVLIEDLLVHEVPVDLLPAARDAVERPHAAHKVLPALQELRPQLRLRDEEVADALAHVHANLLEVCRIGGFPRERIRPSRVIGVLVVELHQLRDWPKEDAEATFLVTVAHHQEVDRFSTPESGEQLDAETDKELGDGGALGLLGEDPNEGAALALRSAYRPDVHDVHHRAELLGEARVAGELQQRVRRDRPAVELRVLGLLDGAAHLRVLANAHVGLPGQHHLLGAVRVEVDGLVYDLLDVREEPVLHVGGRVRDPLELVQEQGGSVLPAPAPRVLRVAASGQRHAVELRIGALVRAHVGMFRDVSGTHLVLPMCTDAPERLRPSPVDRKVPRQRELLHGRALHHDEASGPHARNLDHGVLLLVVLEVLGGPVPAPRHEPLPDVRRVGPSALGVDELARHLPDP